jgi:uncharacterized membrane protein YciS (DUF1049 family)
VLKRFWQKNKKIILISLVVYLILTLLVILGSWNSKDVPFNYQIR